MTKIKLPAAISQPLRWQYPDLLFKISKQYDKTETKLQHLPGKEYVVPEKLQQ